MTNEQTIDEIMALASEVEDQGLIHACGEGDEPIAERDALRHAITAALAAKDAEIAELLDEMQKCSLIALHLDAMHPDAPGSFTGTPSERIGRAIERLKAQLAEPANPVPGEWIEWAGRECPIADDVQHQIRTRDGWESNVDTDASGWDWTRRYGDNAIVAYRVLA